jgi:hypothetical protein
MSPVFSWIQAHSLKSSQYDRKIQCTYILFDQCADNLSVHSNILILQCVINKWEYYWKHSQSKRIIPTLHCSWSVLVCQSLLWRVSCRNKALAPNPCLQNPRKQMIRPLIHHSFGHAFGILINWEIKKDIA